jgi:ATP-binding cassette subfamily C protein
MKYLKFLLNINTTLFFFIVISISILSVLLEYLFVISVPFFLEIFLRPQQDFFFKDYYLFSNLENGKLREVMLFSVFFLFILKNVFFFFSQYVFLKYSYNFSNKVSTLLLSKYLNSKYIIFLDTKNSELIRNVRDNTEQARLVIQNFFTIISESLVFLGLCLFIIYKSSIFNIMAILLIIILSLLYIYFSRNLSKKWSLIRQQYESLKIQNLQESLSGFKEIRIFNQEEWFVKKFSDANINSNLLNLKFGILYNIPRVYLELVGALALILIIILDVKTFNESLFLNLIPLLALYFVAFIRLLPSANRLLTSYETIRFFSPAVKFIYNDLHKKFLNKKISTSDVLNLKKKIEFKNLFFSFPNDKEIFNDINIDINFREKIGIVGESGIGKTTFINILIGLLEPTKGSILCDGVNIQSDIRSWQENIAYIGQSIFLMNDTIENNISFGTYKDEKHYKKINEALKFANLDNLIDGLPEGINTVVGDQGSKLSGGQIQRIGIARALYFNKELIICDEITSSLDNISEENIISFLNRLNKTIVIISHKIENLGFCSKIYENKEKKLMLIKK